MVTLIILLARYEKVSKDPECTHLPQEAQLRDVDLLRGECFDELEKPEYRRGLLLQDQGRPRDLDASSS